MACTRHLIKFLLFVTWLELVFCFTPRLHYGKSADINLIIELWNISFQRCTDNCLARTRCNTLVYFPRLYRCKLGSNVIADSDVSGWHHRVLVAGFEEYHKKANVCGDRVCELTETCIEKEPGTHQCGVTECSPLKRARGSLQTLGNMNTIGSKCKVGQFGVVATCSASGIWTITKTGTDRIITGTSDCLSGTNFTAVDEVPFRMDNLVLCDVTTEGGNWVIFQRRFDGSENFYRGWNDYVNGFGELSGEFWLGLDKLSSIIADTSRGFELRVDMENFEGEKRYAKYSAFSISDAIDMYRLSVGGYTGDAGDSFIWHDDMRFTTYDRDHDVKDGTNCAVQSHGGYWYRFCQQSNLNGMYYHGAEDTGNYGIHVSWFSWTGHYHSLKNTEMKIRQYS